MLCYMSLSCLFVVFSPAYSNPAYDDSIEEVWINPNANTAASSNSVTAEVNEGVFITSFANVTSGSYR